MFYLFDLKNVWIYDRMTGLVTKDKFSLRLNNSKKYFYTIIYMCSIPIVSLYDYFY